MRRAIVLVLTAFGGVALGLLSAKAGHSGFYAAMIGLIWGLFVCLLMPPKVRVYE
jgi:hypothetical protein